LSLLHPPVRRRQRRLRRAITALSVAVTVAVLAGTATVVPLSRLLVEPAAADTVTDVNDTLDPPHREGPFWQAMGEGAYMNFTITYGEDARLGPDAAGDGWHLHAAERLNVVDFFGMTPYGSSSNPHVELYVVAGGGSPQPSDLRKEYDPEVCNCVEGPAPHSTSWQGLDGGALWGRITFTSRTYPHERDTGYVRLWPAGCTCVLPSVRTPLQIENASPVSTVFAPATGTVIHRSTPEHRQEFSALFSDFEHHNIRATYEVRGPLPDGTVGKVLEYTGDVKAAPPPPRQLRGYATGAYPSPVSTPPLELPHRNGTYTFRVQARDTSGRATALGTWSQESTFEYIWNLPPAQPTQMVPTENATLPANVPVAFVAKTVDAENDNLTMETVIDGNDTYFSVPTASGREAVTVIDDGLRPGWHNAVVSATDVNNEEGPSTPPVSFYAEPVVDTANQPPGAPTLVAPATNGSFASGAPQDFVLRAVDPDDDTYRGVIEIADASGNPVTTFATDEAPSGDTIAARPLTALAAGAYQWRARAFDSKGALGPMSAWQPFSVAGSAGTVVSDDCATGTTFTQAAAAGHYAHLQAAGNELCWRIDGPAATSGGKLVVTMPGGGAPPVATVDEDTSACTTVLLDGTVGDPSDPTTYLPFRIATSVNVGEVAVCVDLGNEHRRVRQRLPGAIGTPTVALGFDPPGRQAAAITPPAGLPSSACSGKPGSITHLAGTAGPAFAHVTSWQESPTRLHVCVREQWAGGAGGPNVGGRFTVDTTGPGAGVSAETGTDFGPCQLAVASLGAPVPIEIRRSSSTNPASVCLSLAGSPLRVTAHTGGNPTPPTTTWTPDPGTPGI